MREITNENGVKLQFGPITVDEVGQSRNPNKWQAQVRQEVTSIYPSARSHDSLSDGLFDDQSFGDGNDYIEKRVTWIPVPIGTSKDAVQALIDELPDAVLHKTLSLEPILSDEQLNAMSNGLSQMTLEDYKERFVKDSEGNAVLYANEKHFYRAIKFKKTFEPDTDLRSTEYDKITGAVQMAEPATQAEPVPTGQPANL